MTLKTSDFDFPLEPELIAQSPLERRDQSRLMVLDRHLPGVRHHIFAELPRLLRPSDVLVVNDTRVIPARFYARRHSGGKIEGLFLHESAPGRWRAMLRGAGRCRLGEKLALDGLDGATLELSADLGRGNWELLVTPALPAVEILEKVGTTPLPPYIHRDKAASLEPADRRRYQTVYAQRSGAVAAPTAGLHFTPQLLEQLAAGGVRIVRLTLHVGAGTFLPVKAEELAEHRMHSEWYELSPQAAGELNAARREGRRIVAVGTTSVRVLETIAAAVAAKAGASTVGAEAGTDILSPASGWTDIFIHPPYSFRAVDALITNFHLPRSTLVMLVSAFCCPGGTAGVRTLLDAYAEARRSGYRFFSYGDAMLIE